jgi:hypothetical protein
MEYVFIPKLSLTPILSSINRHVTGKYAPAQHLIKGSLLCFQPDRLSILSVAITVQVRFRPSLCTNFTDSASPTVSFQEL